jgi:hypothetical protein
MNNLKQISIVASLLFIVGCGGEAPQPNVPNQPSIQQQKDDAKSSWRELDGSGVEKKNFFFPKREANLKTEKKNSHIKSNLEVADKIPDWFYSPPKSANYFYGAGEGRDVEEAKVSALNFIAGEINTAVSSSFSKSEGYSNYNGNSNFYRSVKSKTRSEVKKINFTNIEFVKTVKVGNKIYLLVRIDKQKLFNSLKTKFEMLDNEIDTKISSASHYSLLEQLISINKVQPKIEQAISLATILSTLNPNFPIQTYVSKYNSYLAKREQLLHKVTFAVEGSDLFSQKLIELLNEKGYKIGSNSDIKIKLNKQLRFSKTYGMEIVRGTIHIKVVAKGETIHSNSIEVKGISNTKEQAIAKASLNFKQKLEKMGINKLLGFQ